MRIYRRWFAGLLVCWFVGLAGCGQLPLPSNRDCSTPNALFFDDFVEESGCGWLQFSSGGNSAEIADGVLRVGTTTTGAVAWTNPQIDVSDAELSVQARQISDSNDNGYGLICRYSDDENFYVFLISGDGFYAIGKYVSESPDIIYLTGSAPIHYTASDAINQGISTNLLRATCDGNQLSLTVNGQPLISVTDNSHTAGDVGVITALFEPGSTLIEFDNFSVTAP